VLGAVWILYLATLSALGVYGAHRLTLVVRAARARPPAAPPLPDELPVVTVQLPLFNEQAVAARVIAASAALDWPRDRLEIQVLDDSTDETRALCAAEVGRWRAAGIDAVHLHREDRRGWKAGALEAGRAVARGELVLVLDADFVPAPDFLRRTVGHFSDPEVVLVQARWGHLNRERSLLTRLQALLLDGHFAVEQAGRAASGACFNFNGTAGLWRARAIEAAGGWHADTLTEDLDLSYRAALRGGRFVYAADVVAPAELPADLRAFKAQQHRWAKGSAECAVKLLPAVARSGWSWRKRLEAAFHLTHNLPYLLTLVLLLAGGACLALGGGPTWSPWLHTGSAAITLSVLVGFVAVSAARGERLAAIARVPALVGLTAAMAVSQGKAVIEGLAGLRSPFVRTPKDGACGSARAPRRYVVAPSTTIWLERAMAGYLATCAVLALQRGALAACAIVGAFALSTMIIARK
jgi:cellulose synthase/poly-beta-1,6-N-acetylglucosamine synthase-like glycosyltransferase